MILQKKYVSANFTSNVEVSKEVLYISVANVSGLVPSKIFIQYNLTDWEAGSTELKTLVLSLRTNWFYLSTVESQDLLFLALMSKCWTDIHKSATSFIFDHSKFPAQHSRNFSHPLVTPTLQQFLVVVHDHKYLRKPENPPAADSCVLCTAKGHESSAYQ